MEIEIARNARRSEIWWRGLAMLLFTILFGVAECVIVAVVLFQFFSALLTRRTNQRLLTLGQSLSTYVYQIVRFLTFTSEEHPFPLSAWPQRTPRSDGQSKETTVDDNDLL